MYLRQLKDGFACENSGISLEWGNSFGTEGVQQMEMLTRMYWGENEATRALVQFQFDYDANIPLLLEYKPHTPRHELLVPGLVLRHFTAYFNLWIAQQMETDSIVSFDTDLHSIWKQLMVQVPMWEKPFPSRYITEYAKPTAASMPTLPPPRPQAGPRPNLPTSGGAASNTRTHQQVQRNTYPNGNEAAFQVYRSRLVGGGGNKKLKDLVAEATLNGHPVPKNAAGGDMCITFHVLGNCNSLCNRRGDHNTINGGAKHTQAEDAALLAWCGVAIPG